MSRRQLLRLAHSGLLDGLPLSSILGSQSPSRTIHDSSSTATVVNRNPLSNSIAKKPPQSSSSSSQGTVQRRHTSFWTHSYPHTAKPAPPNTSSSSTSIPYAPPSPDALASPASSSSSGTSAAPTLNQSASTTSGRSIWGLRTGGYQYGDNVTVAGHGQNVHVLGSHDPEPSVDLEPLASIVGAAEEEGMAGSAGTPLGAGAGRRRERKHRYLDSLMDKAGEMNLRCSVLDADGEWTLQEGRFKKAELCKEYDLDPRDLRKLDSLAPNLVPIILTRRTCILISILHVRALIKPDKVIIFDIPGVEESEAQRRFKLHLERNVKAGRAAGNEGDARVLLGLQGAGGDLGVKAQTGQAIEDGRRSEKSGAGMRMEEGEEEDADVLPYEHRALESILVATANALEEEMVYTRSLVRHLLADLEDDINRENLKRLLHYSRRMVGFQSRARYVKRSVDEILDNDEDLSAMYLTSTSLGRPRALHDHEQLELLLESFTKQVEEIVSEIDNTVANIQSTQEIAELMLDSGRNTLLALDIKISFATLGAGCAAVVAGVFGMNLTSTLESSPYAFLVTTASAGFFGLFIFIYGLRHLRRVRRVALSDRPRSKRGSVSPTWDHLPSVDPLTGASRYIDADLIRRTRASDKRKIWDMISRSKSSSASAGGLDGSTRSPADTPEMGAWKAKQALARMVGRGQAKGREGANPVWMNAKADHAGARDAWLVALAREKEGDGRGQEGWCAGQRGDRVGQWDAGPWKWGRGRAKWNKE